MRLHGRGQFALGHKLQPLVDGQRERRAGLRESVVCESMPRRFTSVSRRMLAGHAAQFLVEALLDARVALLFEIHRAQHVRRQRAVRIVALALALRGRSNPGAISGCAGCRPPRGVILRLIHRKPRCAVGGLLDLQVEFARGPGAAASPSRSRRHRRHPPSCGLTNTESRGQAHAPAAGPSRSKMVPRGARNLDHHFLAARALPAYSR